MQVFFNRTLEKEFEKVYTKFKSIELSTDEAYQEDLGYLSTRKDAFNGLSIHL